MLKRHTLHLQSEKRYRASSGSKQTTITASVMSAECPPQCGDLSAIGDGFYEQKLIREQIHQLTSRRFLTGYATTSLTPSLDG
jgi:hypothetical protein